MKKHLVSLSLLLLLLSLFSVSFATDYTYEAEALKTLNLFSGTNNGFELDRSPTRVEAAAMLVKFLGKEAEANQMKYTHPFTDVPTWANNLVGYLYHSGLTNGIGNNKFGSTNQISSKDFTVFVLKALGYGASDFSYNDTLTFATKIGLYLDDEKKELESSPFLRGHMVHLSYNSLSTQVKGIEGTLKEQLIEAKAITVEALNETPLATYYEVSIPYSNQETVNYTDEFIEVSLKPQNVFYSPFQIVGKKSEDTTQNGRFFYIDLNGNYTSWHDENLVLELKLVKNDQTIYQTTCTTKPYIGKEGYIQGFGFALTGDDYDHLIIKISPLSEYETNPLIPITFITKADSAIIVDKLKSSNAFSISNLLKNQFDSSASNYMERLSRFISLDQSWDLLNNPYTGSGKLVLNNQIFSTYSVNISNESFGYISYPPNTFDTTININIGTNSEYSWKAITFYDENYNITEVLIIK